MSDNRARIWFALFVLAVFCLGGTGGFLVGRHMPPPPDGPGFFGGRGPGRLGPPFGRGRGGPDGAGPPYGRGAGPLSPDLVNRLSREVELDASQQDQVKRILEERRDRFDQIHRDARGRFDKEQRDLQAAIRAVLRPDQQQKFDAFLDRRR